MLQIMCYCLSTPSHGWTLKPSASWDGLKDYEFEIPSYSNLEYVRDESCHSVNGWSTFLHDSPISFKSLMMPIVALSVMEAEFFATVLCVQDMLYSMWVMNSLGLQVKLSMLLYVNNKGAHNMCHNWSVGGHTCHIKVKQHFLQDLKGFGLVHVVWKAGTDMLSNIFTKNLSGPLFNKHCQHFVSSKHKHEDDMLSDSVEVADL